MKLFGGSGTSFSELQFVLIDTAGNIVTDNRPQLPGGSGWHYFTAAFVAEGTQTKLQFRDEGDLNSLGGFLDDVSIVGDFSGFRLDSDRWYVTEDGESEVQFTVQRSSISGVVHVHYELAGVAVLGTDYAGVPASSGTLTIPDGQASATINLAAIDDAAVEGQEFVTMTLTGWSDAEASYSFSLSEAPTGTIAILDDDDQIEASTTPDAVDDEYVVDLSAGPTELPVLENDYDIDDDSLQIVDVTWQGAGVFQIQDNRLYFVPGEFESQTIAQYTIEDADGNQATAFVQVAAVVKIHKTPTITPLSNLQIDMTRETRSGATAAAITAAVTKILEDKVAAQGTADGVVYTRILYPTGNTLQTVDPSSAHGEAGFVIATTDTSVEVSDPDEAGLVTADYRNTRIIILPFTILYSKSDKQRPIAFRNPETGEEIIVEGPKDTAEHEKWHAEGVASSFYRRAREKGVLVTFDSHAFGFRPEAAKQGAKLSNDLRKAVLHNEMEAITAFDTAFESHFGVTAREDIIAARGYWHGAIIEINGVEHYRWNVNVEDIDFDE